MIPADTIASVYEPSARSDAAYAPHVDTSSVASKTSETSCGWRPAPGELVSLWDMLRIYAKDFTALLTTLDRVAIQIDKTPQWLQFAGVNLQDPIGMSECWKGLWDSLNPLFDDVEGACGRLELTFALKKAQGIRSKYVNNVFAHKELQMALKELRERIDDELNDRILMYVASDKAKFFLEKPPPFGGNVQDKFSGITGDIVDAGWCLGIGRASAAVYHLMRVMEFGVRRLAKRLKLPKRLEHKPWGDILGAARTAINALPYITTKERNRRDRYSETVAHLNSVKDAWRNPTMHSKRRYTQEEAEAIYVNVKTFMNYLADKVF
jgi:hypothetical protein